MFRQIFRIIPLALATLLAGPDRPSVSAQSQQKEIRNSLGMRLVEIPGGSFDMGSTVGPGEAPVHTASRARPSGSTRASPAPRRTRTARPRRSRGSRRTRAAPRSPSD